MQVEVFIDIMLIFLYAVCDIIHCMHIVYKNNDIIKWNVFFSTCNPVTSGREIMNSFKMIFYSGQCYSYGHACAHCYL